MINELSKRKTEGFWKLSFGTNRASEREREIDSHFCKREKEPREKRREELLSFGHPFKDSCCWNFEFDR